jgi:hypothetical protein
MTHPLQFIYVFFMHFIFCQVVKLIIDFMLLVFEFRAHGQMTPNVLIREAEIINYFLSMSRANCSVNNRLQLKQKRL